MSFLTYQNRRETSESGSFKNLKLIELQENYPNYDLSFKAIIIGDPGVGKSSLLLKGIKNIYENFYSATVGFEFFVFNCREVKSDKVIKMQIWDTCGQEVYRSIISSFYRDSALAIIVYSIDRYNFI